MAFAAVVSVEQILNQLILHSDNLFHSDDFPISEIKNFHLQIRSLRSSMENIYPVRRVIRDKVKELESKVRDTVYQAQDLIESFISDQTPQSIFLQTLKETAKKLEEDAETATEIVDSMKKEQLLQQTSLPLSENAQTTVSKSTRANESSKIVGQDEDLKKLKGIILKDTVPDRQVISIWGLPGIGKTTLARSIFVDKDVGDRFSIRSWLTVGEEYNAGEIFLKLLASIEGKGRKSDHGGSDSTKVNHGNDEQIALQLYNSLLHNRYLIVVDDVWGNKVWDRVNNYFPDNKNCSRVIVTTRSDKIAEQVKSDFSHEMKLLGPETSWELLRAKVFGDGGHCPPDLLNIGPSIARHCGGLPLSITVVGGQLSQEMENLEYWKMVEEDTKVASESEQEAYLQILSRSYEHLPGRLKGCFLYMGSFPEDSEILVSRLLKLWVAEGFLFQPSSSSSSSVSLEEIAEQCLMDLVDRNLIIPLKLCSSGKIKTCGTHDSIRHLAERKSEEERFFVSVKKFPTQRNQPRGEAADALKGKEAQRRLSVHKNILMCMEDVYISAKLIKPARTLLYVGHYHHHPLPFCLTYNLLRVLDAVTIHLIKFPNELVQLIHLRYLSLTFNGKLPSSLSQLKNLLVLIVRRYPNIIIMGNSILPVEIWDMKQLRHVLLTECDFPHLPDIRAESSLPLLGNLQSLSNINIATCCSKEFFDKMPNLKKLGIWIEVPGPVNVYVDQLPNLEAFKFAVLNPIPGQEIELQRSLFSPKTLKKLSLSGCGLSWDHMADVGKFPCLQVLKLRQFAFQGKEWIPEEEQFPELKYLLIEYLDLECICVDHLGCGNLENLVIKSCYELKMVHEDLKKIGTLKRVEMIGCNKAVVNCVKDMLDDVSKDGRKVALLSNSSWGN